MSFSLASDLTVLFSSLFFVFLLLAFTKIVHELWLLPNRTRNLMRLQGIKGPSYRSIYGNTKEIITMQNEAQSKPLDVSDHNIYRRLQPHIHRCTNLYGNNYLEWYGPQPHLVITEPELIKEIFSDREDIYPRMKLPVFIKSILGDGLVLSEGEKWAKMRKLANPSFQMDSLRNMIPAMITSVEEILEKWRNREGKEIEVYEEFKRMTSDVISRTAFGSRYEDGKAIFDMLEKLNLIAGRNLYKLRFPGISKIYKSNDEIESEQLEKRLHKSIAEKVRKREEKIMNKEENIFGSDFLGVLLKAHHSAGEKERVSFDEMVDECKALYFGGHDSTSTLLTWTVFLLSVHQDWQDKARKEVLDLFGKEKNPDADGISKLKCLSMVLNESLRLYPPVIIVPRKARKAVRLGKINVPANMILVLPTLALHHDPRIWGKDSHLFKPDRFSQGLVKATGSNAAAFFPFGSGPRTCLGFNFALYEAKIALAMILQRYTFTLSPTHVHSPIQVLTVRPKYGVRVIMHQL